MEEHHPGPEGFIPCQMDIKLQPVPVVVRVAPKNRGNVPKTYLKLSSWAKQRLNVLPASEMASPVRANKTEARPVSTRPRGCQTASKKMAQGCEPSGGGVLGKTPFIPATSCHDRTGKTAKSPMWVFPKSRHFSRG